nr:hypothetical protein [Microbacterium lemovicicum]
MRGRWCAEIADECFDSGELARSYPGTFVTLAASDQYVSGAIRVGICVNRGGDGGCADAASERDYLFLPAGVARGCAQSAEEFSLNTCDPDYTGVNDDSRPRLLHLVKYQQGASYEDVPPMYPTGGE